MEFVFLKFMLSGKSSTQNQSRPRPLSLKTMLDTRASLKMLMLFIFQILCLSLLFKVNIVKQGTPLQKPLPAMCRIGVLLANTQ